MSNLSEKTLILHIGLHKTGTTFLQNKFASNRMELLAEGLLYPSAGESTDESERTRPGAQSGHAMFTRQKVATEEFDKLKLQSREGIKSVIVSSENFTLWKRNITPRAYLDRFKDYGRVIVVLVLRRQDKWIESYYKQIVDGFVDYETRPFEKFLTDEGPYVLDLFHRFSEWRRAAGAENFVPLVYDDFDTPDGIVDEIISLAGGSPALVDKVRASSAEKYASIRDNHTLPLRMLNLAHLNKRTSRIEIAKFIIENTPEFPVTTMNEDTYNSIKSFCTPINERIERDWFDGAATGMRFGKFSPKTTMPAKVAADTVSEYYRFLEHVVMVIEEASSAERK